MPRSGFGSTFGLTLAVVGLACAGSALMHASRVDAAPARNAAAVSSDSPAAEFRFAKVDADDGCPAAGAVWTSGPLRRIFPGHEQVGQPGPGRFFHCDPVLVDGRRVNWETFSTETSGRLTLVHGDPSSAAAEKIAFRVRLRRDGEMLSDADGTQRGEEWYEVDLGAVLAGSRPGDHLIIDPVSPRDWRARRVIELGC